MAGEFGLFVAAIAVAVGIGTSLGWAFGFKAAREQGDARERCNQAYSNKQRAAAALQEASSKGLAYRLQCYVDAVIAYEKATHNRNSR